MKKLWMLAFFASQLFAAGQSTYNAGGYELNRSGPVQRKYNLGTHLVDALQFGVRGQWAFSDQGGLHGQFFLHDAEGKRVSLPAGSIITDCLIDVVTAPASANSSGSLAFTASDSGDLKGATFVSSYTTSKPLNCTPIRSSLSTMIKAASEMTLQVLIGSETLTAGKINVWVQYILSGNQ